MNTVSNNFLRNVLLPNLKIESLQKLMKAMPRINRICNEPNFWKTLVRQFYRAHNIGINPKIYDDYPVQMFEYTNNLYNSENQFRNYFLFLYFRGILTQNIVDELETDDKVFKTLKLSRNRDYKLYENISTNIVLLNTGHITIDLNGMVISPKNYTCTISCIDCDYITIFNGKVEYHKRFCSVFVDHHTKNVLIKTK